MEQSERPMEKEPQTEQELAPHPRHAGVPRVAIDRGADGETLRSLANGRHLLVVQHSRRGGPARLERRREADRTHGLGRDAKGSAARAIRRASLKPCLFAPGSTTTWRFVSAY